jgi:hypothetical protein
MSNFTLSWNTEQVSVRKRTSRNRYRFAIIGRGQDGTGIGSQQSQLARGQAGTGIGSQAARGQAELENGAIQKQAGKLLVFNFSLQDSI